MTLHNLGYLLELRHGIAVHGAALKRHAYICAGAVAQHVGVDRIARARDYVHVYHALYALVDGSAAHTALNSYILRGDAGIMHHYFKNVTIKIVNFIHVWHCTEIFYKSNKFPSNTRNVTQKNCKTCRKTYF